MFLQNKREIAEWCNIVIIISGYDVYEGFSLESTEISWKIYKRNLGRNFWKTSGNSKV